MGWKPGNSPKLSLGGRLEGTSIVGHSPLTAAQVRASRRPARDVVENDPVCGLDRDATEPAGPTPPGPIAGEPR